MNKISMSSLKNLPTLSSPMSHISCLKSSVSHLKTNVSYLTSHISYLATITLCFLCLTVNAQQADSKFLKRLIKKNTEELGVAGQNPQEYEVQIVYTQIDRDEENRPFFTSHYFNVDESRYFYPASTVKMPAAAIALEKLNQLDIPGLDRNAIMLNGVGQAPQTPSLIDSSAENKLPSLAHFIKKVFIVSDNDANNRMYEFCGQNYLNEKLWQKGLTQSRIVHRIGITGFETESNRHTNPVEFIADDRLLYHQPAQYSEISIDEHNRKLSGLQKGKAYQNDAGELIEQPFDFSMKNFLSLPDLSGILQRLIFPEHYPAEQRFDLSDDDYTYLYQCMSIFPGESQYPSYQNKADSYVKFFMYGDQEVDIPDHIRIFNKVGWAYGFLTDVAYIIDTKNKVEFMLSATIHANANQTYNDNTYEEDEIALPFLAGLGRILYEHELSRKRKATPDLTRFANLEYR